MNAQTRIQRKHTGTAGQAAAPQFAYAALRPSGQPLGASVQIQHLAPTPLFQPKLTINAPNDIYEQEAERVADQVMRMPAPSVALQRAPIGIQRCAKCAAATRIEDICPSCAAKASAHTLQRAAASAVPDVTPQAEARINALRGG
ncbi:MAG: hypothetical protein M3R61_05005, partial [Chloroflexota bacterium]|nr:hypothetical protein [Chloroflexota bacterium]